MKRAIVTFGILASLLYPTQSRAAEKYDAGTIWSRGAIPQTNVGPLAARFRGKPVVVRIHADWCPACTQTTPILDAVRKKYGDTITFVTFDVTDEKSATVAAAVAKADGLTKFFDATKTATSTVAVIDPSSGAVIGELYNDIDELDYTKAIDAALLRSHSH